jgi:ribonuclease HI
VTAGPGQSARAVTIEADGGSRGNPGNAAYGAVLKDAASGTVLAERAERIGVATNNVAEYRGLIAGLELYREHADGAELEVRMDSKLVVEQMAGRWKVKHPAMRPLALEANRLAPAGTRWTWVPREQNRHADRLANLALDGPEGVVHGGVSGAAPSAGPRGALTLVLVLEGTAEEVAGAAEWLAAGLAGREGTAPVVVGTSGADPVARRLGVTRSVEVTLDRSPTQLRDRLLSDHPDRVVVAVTGRQQVASLVSYTLGLPSGTPLRAELPAGSVTVLAWSDHGGAVRLLGGLPRLDLATGASDRA